MTLVYGLCYHTNPSRKDVLVGLSFLNLNSRNSQNQDVVHSLNEHSPTLLHNQKAISIIIMANNLVADSDLRAVLQAIDNKLD